jgi:hypothetical protein
VKTVARDGNRLLSPPNFQRANNIYAVIAIFVSVGYWQVFIRVQSGSNTGGKKTKNHRFVTLGPRQQADADVS